MKRKNRLLSLLLILALCLTLAACGNDTAPRDTAVSSTGSAVTTTVTSEATTTATSVEPTTGDVTDPPTSSAATTATASTAGGSTSTTVTTVQPTSTTVTTSTTASSADKALVDRAFALGVGAKIENVTLTGVVTSSQGYSAGYNNATFDLQVEGTSGAKTIYCYRVKPADASRAEVSVGDRLSLSGTIQNYKGTIEFYPATYTHLSGGGVVTTAPTTRPTGGGSAAIDEDGIYESKEDVALYLHTYGKLPKNFVTKSQYNSLGKPADKCCGGDRFYNKEGLLPNKAGRLYYECDIDTYGSTSRGQKRIVYSNDGLIYYTGDHYRSFTLLYGTP